MREIRANHVLGVSKPEFIFLFFFETDTLSTSVWSGFGSVFCVPLVTLDARHFSSWNSVGKKFISVQKGWGPQAITLLCKSQSDHSEKFGVLLKTPPFFLIRLLGWWRGVVSTRFQTKSHKVRFFIFKTEKVNYPTSINRVTNIYWLPYWQG